VKASIRQLALVGVAVVALIASAQAPAQTPLSAGASSIAPTADDVAAFYATYNPQPIWTRGGINQAAVAQLVAILQRAPFDGFADGPQLAAQVQLAVAKAQTADPSATAAAERLLSTAWVRYVQALKRPTPGMIYAYPVLKPQGSGTAQILLTASAAPSLEQHLANVSNVNSIYARLRDTAFAEAQATGNMTPDPRLLANLDRIRSLPAKGRFMLVDSGSSMLTLYQDGQQLDSMKVITGTEELPTPLIASVMYYITYNPYWHAPDHVVRKTIAPNVIHLGLSYFKPHGYDLIHVWSENANVIDSKSIDWKAAAADKLHLKI